MNLQVSNNKLTTIPSDIGNLKKLKQLNCSWNSLSELPKEIGNIDSLETFHLEYNNLTTVPSSIGNLSNLDYLCLSNNNLTYLPDSIVKLTNLSYMCICYNKLDSNTMSEELKAWADKYDPEWRFTQNVPIIYNQIINHFEFSINLNNSSILFTLLKSGNTKLQIYTIKGRLLETLLDSYKQAGKHTVDWDCKRFGAGVYFLKLSANGYAVSEKFTIIK